MNAVPATTTMSDTALRCIAVHVKTTFTNSPGLTMAAGSDMNTDPNSRLTAQMALLVSVVDAARITGLPVSLIRKSFIREEKRPKNVPAPPPHKRLGRSVYILAEELPAWVKSLGTVSDGTRRKRGRPTVTERIAARSSMNCVAPRVLSLNDK